MGPPLRLSSLRYKIPPIDLPLLRLAMKQHSIEIEVRYYETDGQGIVHHANYFQYFELARVQMLKAMGHHYADLERDGYLLVVHKIGCRFLLPAKFGDTLRIVTTVERATAARIDHSYKVYRDDILLAEADSTLACINRVGQVQRMPNMLYEDPLADEAPR